MDNVWGRMNLPRCMSQLAFYLRQTRMLLLCLLFVWINASCRSSSTDSLLPLASPDVTRPEAGSDPSKTSEYWSGGEFSGQAVYSLSQGISQTAHDIFAACGLGDEQIKTAVATHLDKPEIQYRGASRQGISEVAKDRQTIWSVSIMVTTISDDLYHVSCFGKRP